MAQSWLRRAAAFAVLCLMPFAAQAQDVTLTSRDGTLTVSGEFRGYDGELYRVMTEYGLLTLDAQGVICDGPACPDLTQFVAEVRVTGEPDLGTRLLDPLLARLCQRSRLCAARRGRWRDGTDRRCHRSRGRPLSLPASRQRGCRRGPSSGRGRHGILLGRPARPEGAHHRARGAGCRRLAGQSAAADGHDRPRPRRCRGRCRTGPSLAARTGRSPFMQWPLRPVSGRRSRRGLGRRSLPNRTMRH